MKIFTHSIGDTNYTIKVGQNAKENWTLVDNSESFDLWIHFDSFPSSHVVISQDVKSNSEIFYPNQIVSLGSYYCKLYSKLKTNSSKIKVVYTRIENLKKGKIVGEVIVSNPNYFSI
jgi:predicted ribosome quality control (RQC) complex YloA/Tae2 family protein